MPGKTLHGRTAAGVPKRERFIRMRVREVLYVGMHIIKLLYSTLRWAQVRQV